MDKMFDIDAGNVKVAQLDELEAKRVAEIRNTPNKDFTGFGGKFFYVSQSGNDTNSGRSKKDPIKSINRALMLAAAGDAVLLERGGCWREKIIIPGGVTLSAYGEGKKPIISGSPENGADPEKWMLVSDEKDSKKVWKYVNEAMLDVGSIFFDGGDDFSYKGYAKKALPNYRAGKFRCVDNPEKEYNPCEKLDNLEFFHAADSELNGEYIATDRACGPLYLRCDAGNPGEIYSQIEFNTKGNNIRVKGDQITVDNICIVHTGSHGIGTGTISGLTVTNCEVGWIGGSIQSYVRNEVGSCFRFGNGIEIYGGCKDYTIENCYVHNCYDAGITHQYSRNAKGDCIMDDVLYKDNVITDCVYNIEYFHSEYVGYVRTGKNILMEGNLLRRAGWGFGSTRPNGHAQGHIRSGGESNPFKNFVIKDNIFDRSVAYLVQCETQAEEYIPKMQGNTYIQGVENRLCHFGVPSQWASMDDDTYDHIKNLLKDEDAKVYFVEHIPYYEFKEYNGEK